MAFDYSGLLATADRLINRFGRSITLVRASRNPSDPAKPWATRATDSDTQSIVTFGAFIETESDDDTDTTTKRTTANVLVQAAPELPEEMGPDWQLDDGTRRYELISSKPVRPGSTLLYYDLTVRL